MVKVMIVEDSPVMREILLYVLNADPEISVIGTAQDGEEALKLVASQKPDAVVLDLGAPLVSGSTTPEQILELHPCSIIAIFDTWDPEERFMAREAIQSGVKAVLGKSFGLGPSTNKRFAEELKELLKHAPPPAT